MTQAQRVARYNELYNYDITGIKKMTNDEIVARATYGSKSLDELYVKCSDAKRKSYQWILDKYEPSKILAVAGNSMTYTVLLIAGNGDVLHITRNNNYLVEITA